jgi:glycine cleavage system H protein
MTPNDRRYTKTHEWVKMDGAVAVVGITDHAQESLGDMTFVETPAVGRRVAPGDSCGVVESVKAASDIYAPVGGEVIEVNAAIDDDPGLVNKDPYGKGWIYKLGKANAADLAGLLDAKGYEATLE